MRYIADLHVHSKYSRATSPEMTPEGLWRWAQMKGIRTIGTGDFTHPAWIKELAHKLVPAEAGLFTLREKFKGGDVPPTCRSEVSFMLTAEISSIYGKGGRTRKVHSIILAPGFEAALEINRRLAKVGNLASDGRPILGLDAKELLRIVLDASPEATVIPAHAWTPHFSVFGAASGFDSIEECYEELAPHIRAIETGLSSDPPMNRRLSALDNITLLSNSDAHSPSKLGREATVFDAEVSYPAITGALAGGKGLAGTIEFFPEEGKYHMDGHRKCGVSMAPEETRRRGGLCPVCGRKLTVGVLHRVEELADRKRPAVSDFRYIVPLQEIIAECRGAGVNTRGVMKAYYELLSELGSEFHILLDAPVADIESSGGEVLAKAIERMRRGEVHVEPGFDGEYGKVRVFGEMDKGRQRTAGRVAGKKPQGRLF